MDSVFVLDGVVVQDQLQRCRIDRLSRLKNIYFWDEDHFTDTGK